MQLIQIFYLCVHMAQLAKTKEQGQHNVEMVLCMSESVPRWQSCCQAQQRWPEKYSDWLLVVDRW